MPKPDSDRHVVRVYGSPEWYRALREAAEREGVTVSKFVRAAVARELGDRDLAAMRPAHRPKKSPKNPPSA